MSSPHVAAVVCLIHEKHPELPLEQMKTNVLAYSKYDMLLLNPRYASVTPNINLQVPPLFTLNPTRRPTKNPTTKSPTTTSFLCSSIKNRRPCNRKDKCRWSRRRNKCLVK
jgi:hypothetical protein